jgi:hypothetical protein
VRCRDARDLVEEAMSDQAERRHADGVKLLAALSIEHYGDADLEADLAIVEPFLAAAEQRGAERAEAELARLRAELEELRSALEDWSST